MLFFIFLNFNFFLCFCLQCINLHNLNFTYVFRNGPLYMRLYIYTQAFYLLFHRYLHSGIRNQYIYLENNCHVYLKKKLSKIYILKNTWHIL